MHRFHHLEIHQYTLGTLDTNCYLLHHPGSHTVWIVDPADDGDFLSEEVERLGAQPGAIILTHGHCDHVLGLLPLRLNYPDTPIYCHPDDHFLIERAQESARHWFGYTPDPVPMPTHTLAAGQTIELGAVEFEVLEVPGHTPGSVALFAQHQNEPAPLLISGDVIFKNGVGRSDFSYARPLQLERSIATLLALDPHTLCLPGHGSVFRLSEHGLP